jgi:hypothetical protein
MLKVQGHPLYTDKEGLIAERVCALQNVKHEAQKDPHDVVPPEIGGIHVDHDPRRLLGLGVRLAQQSQNHGRVDPFSHDLGRGSLKDPEPLQSLFIQLEATLGLTERPSKHLQDSCARPVDHVVLYRCADAFPG